MKEHYQLFCTEMVQALRAAKKQQTRRLITPENSLIDGKSARTREGKALWAKLNFSVDDPHSPPVTLGHDDEGPFIVACERWISASGGWLEHIIRPYVRTGDLLLVKETHARVHPDLLQHLDPAPDSPLWQWVYRADGEPPHWKDYGLRWTPSILMPREAVRLRLEVTMTRPERLQVISPDDCAAEGVVYPVAPSTVPGKVMPLLRFSGKNCPAEYLPLKPGAEKERGFRRFEVTHETLLRAHYASLWDTLNAEAGTRWADNPLVWVRGLSIAS